MQIQRKKLMQKGISGCGKQLTMQNPESLFHVHVRLVARIYTFKESSGNYGFLVFLFYFWSFSRGVSVWRGWGPAPSLRGAWSFPKRPLPKGKKRGGQGLIRVSPEGEQNACRKNIYVYIKSL